MNYLWHLLLLLSTMSATTTHALSTSIVVVGLNAALQKRFILPPNTNLEPGNVHRAHNSETGVGGKGQDVGVAMSCLMSKEKQPRDDKVLLAQFLGMGPEGDAVSGALRLRRGLSDKLTIRNAAPLRTCTTIVGKDCATELVETSGEVTEEELEQLGQKVESLVNDGGKASGVCIMGSMPPGCGDDTYAQLSEKMVGKDTLVLIDSVIGLDALLKTLKSCFESDDREGGAVLKLNAAELCKLAGANKSEAEKVTVEELTTATRCFLTKYECASSALDYLCVTDGKFPGYLVEVPKESTTENKINFIQLPAIDISKQVKGGMLYPIGAGDTVAAGTLAAWQYLHHEPKAGEENFFGVVPKQVGNILSSVKSKWLSDASSDEKSIKMATSFAFGLSCGSASCLQQENSVFDVDDAVRYFSEMDSPVIQ
uniref:Carbohydrate kinase PfkB domain-containing protein n=1 Tax=Skeletonema marinoi TaxID=267567 RepID=A0A7S2L182_9STRA|mmetsp:Transcript_19576/g.33113  ORF Transcript_19576/g.33113 Transcript_19576/m.33113 type:complete len:426 (+) Transcript_19576:103-1380(+)